MGDADTTTVPIGRVEIFLPTASQATFWFSDDLTALLGVETNAEAEERLRAELRAVPAEERPKGRITFDTEADEVMVSASNAQAIVFAARLLHRLAGVALDEAELARAEVALAAWRRPKRQRWEVGDVFSVPLDDGSFAFGQVLGTYLVKSPTCALFERRVALATEADVDEAIGERLITVLHVDDSSLADGSWRVLGRRDPVVGPDSGPWKSGTSTGAGAITYLANAWWGLTPWNVLADDDYLDRQLMRGMKRPATARVLSPEERDAFRRANGWEK